MFFIFVVRFCDKDIKKARTGEGGLNLTMNYAFSLSTLKEDNAGYLTQDEFHDNPT
ncbi:hypothetical protein GCM10011445_10970 [Pseudocitrobacter faecalis]|nr:hypothetical protein GCM10011445_10970 [Pseudocitrobacter faecalis]